MLASGKLFNSNICLAITSQCEKLSKSSILTCDKVKESVKNKTKNVKIDLVWYVFIKSFGFFIK